LAFLAVSVPSSLGHKFAVSKTSGEPKNASEWRYAQDDGIDDRKCWNALEESAVIMSRAVGQLAMEGAACAR
jgi:hypothetical protein